jgi:hypothetical protein
MTDTLRLIPSPPVVRERLAHNIRERRLLRALLRLSVRAVEDSQRTPLTASDCDANRADGRALGTTRVDRQTVPLNP